MKRSLMLAVLLTGAAARAEGPDDLYLKSFGLIEQAEALGRSGQTTAAVERLEEARTQLLKVQSSYPAWNQNMVRFRLENVGERITALGGRPAAAVPATAPVRPAQPAPTAADTALLQEEIGVLRGQIVTLQTKLKEALSMQSSGLTAAERSRLEEQVSAQQRELEIARVALEQEKARTAAATAAATEATALAEAGRRARELARENETLAAKVKEQSAELVRGSQAAATERDNLQRALATAVTAKETAERQARDSVPAGRVTALEAEKTALGRELEDVRRKLAFAESKLREFSSQPKTAPVVAPTLAPAAPSSVDATKMAALEARLAALDAKAVPYTPEELALFKAPPTRIVVDLGTNAVTQKKSVRRVPVGAGDLVARAERAYVARRHAEAEQLFSEALKQEEDNVYLLAHIASSQFEQGKVAEAEKHLEQALRSDPEDPTSLTLMGIVRFQQDRIDEALTHLSLSAKLDPNNADTQNYLGITLSQKGQRAAAEAALRRSLQLAPDNANAHHNLAIIYATQQPPFTELAGFHYRKAVALGHPANPGLEEQLRRE